MTKWFSSLCAAWLALCLCGANAGAQGQLERFEKSVKESGSSSGISAATRSYSGHTHGSFGDHLAHEAIEGVVEGVLYGMAYGGFNSVALIHPEAWEGKEEALSRRPGDALIPFAEFDACFQDVEGDVVAWDYRAEVGYACLGFAIRRTFYREHDRKFELDTVQYHGLYRMTFGDSFEIDMGFGALEIKGSEENVGFSFALPMRFHLHEGFGVEYRPVWSTIDENRIYDTDLAVVLGWGCAYFRAGYRWFYCNEESLSGPQAGISLRW